MKHFISVLKMINNFEFYEKASLGNLDEITNITPAVLDIWEAFRQFA